jgi:alpha-beta hydrolase superfamily lysophospholipase
MATWQPDTLGGEFTQLTLVLGHDPDGETDIVATLVRYGKPKAGARAVLWVHGFTDYFFQAHVAEWFRERGYNFFALDMRKAGRSTRPGQSPHYARDMGLYGEELDTAVRIIGQTSGEIIVVAHSTAGLTVPLWLDSRRAAGKPVPAVAGLVLDSPWFDLQGSPLLRSAPVTALIYAIGKILPKAVVPMGVSEFYTQSVADEGFELNDDWKPLKGFPVRFGWIRAVRKGHARLHKGLDIGVPSLVLRSARSIFTKHHTDASNRADLVLDVQQIARWSGCLGNRVTVVPIEGARHDVFVSQPDAREKAFAALDDWLKTI